MLKMDSNLFGIGGGGILLRAGVLYLYTAFRLFGLLWAAAM